MTRILHLPTPLNSPPIIKIGVEHTIGELAPGSVTIPPEWVLHIAYCNVLNGKIKEAFERGEIQMIGALDNG